MLMTAYIASEMSWVDFDFQILSNCGTKEKVVQAPAISPRAVSESIGAKDKNRAGAGKEISLMILPDLRILE